MADYILLMQMDIPTELEDDFNHFYNTQNIRLIPCGSCSYLSLFLL